jgi:hypothetical protein
MRKVLLTLALVGLLAVPVCAQFGFGFGRGMDATQLILQKSVQEELKLSDDQKKALTEANDAFQKAFREAIQEKDFSGIAKANETRTEAVKKVIEKLGVRRGEQGGLQKNWRQGDRAEQGSVHQDHQVAR